MNRTFRILNWLIVVAGVATTAWVSLGAGHLTLPITGAAILPAILMLRVLEAPRSTIALTFGALLNAAFAALGLFGFIYAVIGAAAQPFLVGLLSLLLCALPFGANAVFLLIRLRRLRKARAGENF